MAVGTTGRGGEGRGAGNQWVKTRRLGTGRSHD